MSTQNNQSPQQSTTALPRVVCAWCQRLMREGDTDQPISHGICNACMGANFPENAVFRAEQFRRYTTKVNTLTRSDATRCTTDQE